MKADLAIVEEVKGGNTAAFGELVERHKKVILRMALRMTRDLGMAEDVVQEAFIKAFTKIHMFEGRASFKSWLYQIASNTAKNKLRSLRHHHVDVDKVHLSVGSQLEGQMFHKDVQKILQEEIQTLPPKQREALSLRIFDDLSFKEIADIMECPYDTAKANYRHALMKLRYKFEESSELSQLSDFNVLFSAKTRGLAAEVD